MLSDFKKKLSHIDCIFDPNKIDVLTDSFSHNINQIRTSLLDNCNEISKVSVTVNCTPISLVVDDSDLVYYFLKLNKVCIN